VLLLVSAGLRSDLCVGWVQLAPLPALRRPIKVNTAVTSTNISINRHRITRRPITSEPVAVHNIVSASAQPSLQFSDSRPPLQTSEVTVHTLEPIAVSGLDPFLYLPRRGLPQLSNHPRFIST
jgi:hypothetical protein